MAAPNDTKLFDSVGYWQKGRPEPLRPKTAVTFPFREGAKCDPAKAALAEPQNSPLETRRLHHGAGLVAVYSLNPSPSKKDSLGKGRLFTVIVPV